MHPRFYWRETLTLATKLIQRTAILSILLLLLSLVLFILLVSVLQDLLPVALLSLDLTSIAMAVLLVQIGSAIQLFTMWLLLSLWLVRSQGSSSLHPGFRSIWGWSGIGAFLLNGGVLFMLLELWMQSALSILWFGSTSLAPLLFMGMLDLLLITVVSLVHLLHAVVFEKLEDNEEPMESEHEEK